MRIDRVKLIAEMARQDLSVQALAKKSCVARGTISNIRCGKTCSPESAIKIARALGVDVTEIIEEGRV